MHAILTDFFTRWGRGWAILIRASLMILVAYLPFGVLDILVSELKVIEPFPVPLYVAITYFIVLLPLVFDWIAHLIGFPLQPDADSRARLPMG